MAANVTLLQMRTRVRELADMETSAQASAFVDDAELTRAINRALKQLYGKLVVARGNDYYATITTMATVVDQANYALPANFMQLLKVVVTDGSRWKPLNRWGYDEWANLRELEANTGGIEFYKYQLVGANIEIRPVPKVTSHTLHIHYIKTFTELAADGDTFDGVNGWEDWSAYKVAIDMLNKEESFEQASALAAQQRELEQQIEAMAGNRDVGEPPTMQDTRRDWPLARARATWRWDS